MLWIVVAILVLGGIAMAFDVSILGAILIICGILAAVIIVLMLRELVKNDKAKKIISIVLVIAIILVCVFVFSKCWGGSDDEVGDEWSKCMKCKGSGKVKNSLGYYVDCSRCDGVGYIPY